MSVKPTREQVIAEQTGAQMDAWVAEFVMGDLPPRGIHVDDYSTYIAEAMEVVEKLAEERIFVTISNSPAGWAADCERGIWGDADYIDGEFIEANTAPLAICRAALLAKII